MTVTRPHLSEPRFKLTEQAKRRGFKLCSLCKPWQCCAGPAVLPDVLQDLSLWTQ